MMSDYRQDQDWLMRELEEKQQYLERKAIEDIINGIDRKLRSRIVRRMRMSKTFAHINAKDCFDRWKVGYREQKPSAVGILKALQ